MTLGCLGRPFGYLLGDFGRLTICTSALSEVRQILTICKRGVQGIPSLKPRSLAIVCTRSALLPVLSRLSIVAETFPGRARMEDTWPVAPHLGSGTEGAPPHSGVTLSKKGGLG